MFKEFQIDPRFIIDLAVSIREQSENSQIHIRDLFGLLSKKSPSFRYNDLPATSKQRAKYETNKITPWMKHLKEFAEWIKGLDQIQGLYAEFFKMSMANIMPRNEFGAIMSPLEFE